MKLSAPVKKVEESEIWLTTPVALNLAMKTIAQRELTTAIPVEICPCSDSSVPLFSKAAATSMLDGTARQRAK